MVETKTFAITKFKTSGCAEGEFVAEFEGVVTTKAEDRDGDILHPMGAKLDKRMPLLLSHDAKMPVGKILAVTEQTEDRLVAKYAIVDTDLGRDAVKLIRAGIMRLSHGFIPKKYTERKSSSGIDGWDISEYEIIETSLVAVPSNRETEITGLSELKLCTPIAKGLLLGCLPKERDAMSTKEKKGDVASVDAASLAEIETRLAELEQAKKTEPEKKTAGPTAKDVFKNVRVKKPSEHYRKEWLPALHARTRLPVRDERGRQAQIPSEETFAKAGSFLKMLGHRAGLDCPLSEHERELLDESFNEDDWTGKMGGVFHDRIPGLQVKALLDDSTSGGAEVVPIWFDEAIVQFPLLSGELYPFVDLVPVPRGRNVEGASIDNPTVTWGTADGTTQAAFNTASLIAELNTTIYPVSVNVEVGRDFLADAAVDVGRRLVENIGQRFANELDSVIAQGNGTSEPQGLSNATGITDVGNPANGAGGVPKVEDWETLMFSIGKQYRNRAYSPAFIANDTSYQRSRAIAVSGTDQRRVFGMSENDYMLLDWPFKVQNDLGNATQFFGCLKKYRMYRRQGQSVQWTSEGKTLAQANLALLVVRGRYGGRVMDTNAFAKQTNAQA